MLRRTVVDLVEELPSAATGLGEVVSLVVV
jgi:hypothetical protein